MRPKFWFYQRLLDSTHGQWILLYRYFCWKTFSFNLNFTFKKISKGKLNLKILSPFSHILKVIIRAGSRKSRKRGPKEIVTINSAHPLPTPSILMKKSCSLRCCLQHSGNILNQSLRLQKFFFKKYRKKEGCGAIPQLTRKYIPDNLLCMWKRGKFCSWNASQLTYAKKAALWKKLNIFLQKLFFCLLFSSNYCSALV